MSRRRKPRLTPAKAQRAMDALVALIETGELDSTQVQQIDGTCDMVRKLRDRTDQTR